MYVNAHVGQSSMMLSNHSMSQAVLMVPTLVALIKLCVGDMIKLAMDTMTVDMSWHLMRSQTLLSDLE